MAKAEARNSIQVSSESANHLSKLGKKKCLVGSERGTELEGLKEPESRDLRG